MMKLLSALLFVSCLTAICLAQRNPSIILGGSELSLGMSQDAVLALLKQNPDYRVTKIDEGWSVFDTAAKRVIGVLTIDHGNLWSVSKSWTPASDKASDVVEALYNVLEQQQRNGSTCFATAQHQAQPNFDSRDVQFHCRYRTGQMTTIRVGVFQPGTGQESTVSIDEIVTKQ